MKERRDASLAEMNRDLHMAIAEGTQNKGLIRVMEVLLGMMNTNMWPRLKRMSEQRERRVEEHLDHKKDIFSRIWEKEDLPLMMWDKDSAEDDDKYFRNELIMIAGPREVGEVLIPRRLWTPLFKLLRKIRIYLGW